MNILTLLSTAIMLCAIEPIGVFDLTYTLQFDANDQTQVAAAWDHCHTASTLQGNVNREQPLLYFHYVNNGGINVDDYWLDKMSEPGQWLEKRSRKDIPDLISLIKEYRRFIKGAVVYDPNVPATSNLASTIAGVENLIAIRYDASPDSLYSKVILNGIKLPVIKRLINLDGSSLFTGKGTIPSTDIASTGSAKCDAYLWLKHNYIDSGKVDATYAGYYIDSYWQQNPTAANPNQHTLTNHDFFVSKRGFFFDLGSIGDEKPVDDIGQPMGTDLKTLQSLLLSAYHHGGKDTMIHIGGFTP
jgi:GxGYxY motif-containing protein